MPDLHSACGAAYVFGPWTTPSDRPHHAYRAAPREDDRAEVWLYVSEDGAESYWCGCWGGMTDSVELRDARDIGEAQRALDEAITAVGHYFAEVLTPDLSSLADLPRCGDCPVGGREGTGPTCPRSRLCDMECAEMSQAMDADGLEDCSPHRLAIETNGKCLAHDECGCIMSGDTAPGCEWESFCHHHLPATAPENSDVYEGDWKHPDFQSNGGCSCECHPEE